jgi:hypothetical protein
MLQNALEIGGLLAALLGLTALFHRGLHPVAQRLARSGARPGAPADRLAPPGLAAEAASARDARPGRIHSVA